MSSCTFSSDCGIYETCCYSSYCCDDNTFQVLTNTYSPYAQISGVAITGIVVALFFIVGGSIAACVYCCKRGHLVGVPPRTVTTTTIHSVPGSQAPYTGQPTAAYNSYPMQQQQAGYVVKQQGYPPQQQPQVYPAQQPVSYPPQQPGPYPPQQPGPYPPQQPGPYPPQQPGPYNAQQIPPPMMQTTPVQADNPEQPTPYPSQPAMNPNYQESSAPPPYIG